MNVVGKFLGKLGWSPAKPGVTFLDHGAEDLWNKTKATDPNLRTAMEQLESDRNHYLTVQTTAPWPDRLEWTSPKGEERLGQTTYVARPDESLDGSQIFIRQSDLTEENPTMPAYVLAHEVGHIFDRLSSPYSDDLANQTPYQTPADVHGPDSYSTKFSDLVANSLNIPLQCTTDFSANQCRPDQPTWEAPIQPNPPPPP
jgi:hypothetical protein